MITTFVQTEVHSSVQWSYTVIFLCILYLTRSEDDELTWLFVNLLTSRDNDVISHQSLGLYHKIT